MSRNPVLLGGITLLLVNVLYFWLNPAAPPHDEDTAETERWYFASLPPAEKIDLQALLSSGAWGLPPAPEETRPGKLAAHQLTRQKQYCSDSNFAG